MTDKKELGKEEIKEKFKGELGFIPPGVFTGESLGEDFQQIISDYHDIVWRDEVIPLKYKYLIALSSAVFDDHEQRAKLEMKKAIKEGASRKEIIEVFRQIVWLTGAPTLVKLTPLLRFMNKQLDNE